MKLARVLAAVVVLAAAGCTGDEDPIGPSPGGGGSAPLVTELFNGTLTRNGADTHPFSVASSGGIRATISRLEPDAAAIVGLSLGTWNGSACQTVIANDRATTAVSVVGSADRAGRLCVRIYDADGTLAEPTTYEIAVERP